MTNDLEELKTYATKLRTDLSATNLVLLSIAGTLTADQQQRSLAAIAQLSVLQEKTAEKAGMQEAIAPLQQSIQRLHSALEGAYKVARG